MLDQFLGPLSRCLDKESARRTPALGDSAPVQERVDTLVDRANDGLLSDEERAEYEALVKAEDFDGSAFRRGSADILRRLISYADKVFGFSGTVVADKRGRRLQPRIPTAVILKSVTVLFCRGRTQAFWRRFNRTGRSSCLANGSVLE